MTLLVDLLNERLAAAERECEQLRAERDQALELLREVQWSCGDADHDGLGSLVLALITTSGLLDGKEQVNPDR